jgi:hypothetical protein
MIAMRSCTKPFSQAVMKPPLEQVAQLSVQGHQSQANQLFQNEIVRDEAMQQTLETTTNYNISEAKRHTAKTVDEAAPLSSAAPWRARRLILGLFSFFRCSVGV